MLQYCISNFDKSKRLNENSVVIYLNNNIIENETTKPYCVFYYPSEYNQKIFNLNDTYLEHFDLKKTKSDYREEIEGWIAKRNLMTYCDYQFKSDDLYNLD